MSHRLVFLWALLLAVSLGAADLEGPISGSYVEARTSDIYTGPCFANSEVNVAGREAVLAWSVDAGGWQGADLSGLGVVAVVRAQATLGDPHSDPFPARAVLVVDERANAEQKRALIAFARSMAEPLLDHIVDVETAPIVISVTSGGDALVRAGDLASLRTRGITQDDHLCGNEEIFYPPLARLDQSLPAVTLEHSWRGPGLNATWSSPGKRSAFVGTFSR